MKVDIRNEGTENRAVVLNEGSKTRAAIFDLANDIQNQGTTANHYDLLSCFHYKEMKHREADIDESFSGTYQWIFRDTTKHTWATFSAWLAGPEKVYWISGKPGSGKSTPMKYILSSKELLTKLSEARPNVQITIICHFIWLAGSEAQHTRRGLLAALIYELAHKDKDVRTFVESTVKLHPSRRDLRDWPVDDLEDLLIDGIKQHQGLVYISIDGYDESIHSEHKPKLLQLLKRLTEMENIKLCVSSRPEKWLVDHFHGCPMLKVQDLNEGDIKTMVTETLEKQHSLSRAVLGNDEKMQRLSSAILWKAEAVFLWVNLHSTAFCGACSMRTTLKYCMLA